MGRRERLEGFYNRLLGYENYSNLDTVLSECSYYMGINLRTLKEYLKVLEATDKIKISYHNPGVLHVSLGSRWLVKASDKSIS
jgi:hypothetical protein